MLPLFVTVKVTGPAGTVASDSRIVHSDSLALTGAGSPRRAGMAAPRAATRQPGKHAGRDNRFWSHTVFLVLGWHQYRSSGRLLPPAAYSVGNKLVAVRSLLSMGCPRHTRGPVLEPSELERFEAVVLPHLSAAYGLARYLTRNDADADDVVQEAFLRALKYFGGFRGDGASQSRAWLLAIVRNTAHTWRRRHRADAVDDGVRRDGAQRGDRRRAPGIGARQT